MAHACRNAPGLSSSIIRLGYNEWGSLVSGHRATKIVIRALTTLAQLQDAYSKARVILETRTYREVSFPPTSVAASAPSQAGHSKSFSESGNGDTPQWYAIWKAAHEQLGAQLGETGSLQSRRSAPTRVLTIRLLHASYPTRQV